MDISKKLLKLEQQLPLADAFQTLDGREGFVEQPLLVPKNIEDSHEKLLDLSFAYLFLLDVAREANLQMPLDQMRAQQGHDILKKKYPTHLRYDYRKMTASMRMNRFVNAVPYTVQYGQNAVHIYAACHLFAQLDLIAQIGEAPDKLGNDFFLMPGSAFMNEFEELQEVALAKFIDGLTHQTNATIFIEPETRTPYVVVNDTLINLSLSANPGYEEQAVTQLISNASRLMRHANAGVTGTPSFHKVGLYKARFGQLNVLDL